MTVVLKDRYLKLGSEDETRAVEKLVQDVMNSNSPVSVTQLKGGITNQLLLAQQDGNVKLLVRAFGKGTGNFIDRNREFVVHRQLQALGLAPRLFGQFGNGLVYAYVPGRTTDFKELSEPYIMRNVSRRVAQWHAELKPEKCAEEYEKESKRKLGDFWSVLEEWVNICPDGVLQISLAELKQTFKRLKPLLQHRGGLEVMGHCDLLSANILVPANTDASDGVPAYPRDVPDKKMARAVYSEAAFIDYEYAMPCPRAFDIANHFQEWQGYECKKSLVPKPDQSCEKLMYWCEEYLSTFDLLAEQKSNIDVLITELQAWWGVPGFFWGVWSAIQSKSSEIDFGYHEYAGNRFQEFLDWQARYKP